MKKFDQKQEFINATQQMHVGICFVGTKKPQVSKCSGFRNAESILNRVKNPRMSAYDKSERPELRIAFEMFGYPVPGWFYSIDTDKGEFVFVDD